MGICLWFGHLLCGHSGISEYTSHVWRMPSTPFPERFLTQLPRQLECRHVTWVGSAGKGLGDIWDSVLSGKGPQDTGGSGFGPGRPPCSCPSQESAVQVTVSEACAQGSCSGVPSGASLQGDLGVVPSCQVPDLTSWQYNPTSMETT